MRNKPLAAAKVRAYADTNGVPTQIESNHTNQGQRDARQIESNAMISIPKKTLVFAFETLNEERDQLLSMAIVLERLLSPDNQDFSAPGVPTIAYRISQVLHDMLENRDTFDSSRESVLDRRGSQIAEVA